MRVEANYWQQAERIGRQVFQTQVAGTVDEQAGPAYFAGLWLSRQLFWRRLARAVAAIPAAISDGNSVGNSAGISAGERKSCLDFGCGFGLLLPLLSRNFTQVIGVDLRPELAQRFTTYWNRQAGHDAGTGHSQISIVSNLKQAKLEPGSVDLILALDVLEHIADRSELLGEFSRLLSPNGTLLVSGPSENWCYRFGRRIVGFSGHYHVCNIYDIKREMLSHFQIERMASVPRSPVLFEILVASHRR